MPGCIIGKVGIAVDFWNIRRAPWLKRFFLTHVYRDQVKGLTSTWQYPIYCSELSAALLQAKLGLPKQLVRPLTIGDRHCIPLDDDRVGETITVTVLDAHHCPGSVMYQFEGHFGTVLVTGDFRFCSGMQRDLSEFVKSVDVLYLDNTYCDPRCEFPPRSNCTDEIVSIIRNHPNHRILLGMHSLGKEELLVEIALAVQTKIVVTPERMDVIHFLKFPDVFTVDNNESRIQVIPLSSAASVSRWIAECDTIIVLCTAFDAGMDGRPYYNHSNVFVVPYSNHSCYSDLRTFVGLVAPRSIVPLVPYSSPTIEPLGVSLQHRADMTCFNDILEMSQVLPLVASGAASERVVLVGRPSPSPVERSTSLCGAGRSREAAQRTGDFGYAQQLGTARLPKRRRNLRVRFADELLLPLTASTSDIAASLDVSPSSSDNPSRFAVSTGDEECGGDDDDSLSFYIPRCLRVRHEDVVSSVMHKLRLFSSSDEGGV